MKISIVTVSYNAVSSIERTIKSVVEQRYANIEYIIIDGGSTDGTVDIIRKYKEKIDYWVSEPDGGIYPAMNKGIEKSTGDYLIFMNAGDHFVSDKTIEQVVHKIKKEDAIVYGYILKRYNKSTVHCKPLVKKNPDAVDFVLWSIDHQAAFINKDLFNRYGLYDTNYRLASDWFFFMKTVGLNKEKINYVNIPVAYFYMDGVSTTSKDKYYNEKNEILHLLFGEYYNYMYELAEFRKSSILVFLLKVRLHLKNSIITKFIRFCQNSVFTSKLKY